MARPASAISRKRRAPSKKATAGFSDTPRLLSNEEKRELIRAHAASRAPQDPVQRLSLWAGVVLSVLVIGAGWWMTVGRQVRQAVSQQSMELRKLTSEMDQFVNIVQTSPALNPPQIPNGVSQAAASPFDALLKDQLMGSATRTRDLLAPAPPELQASVSATSASPSVPAGLIPDDPNP